MIRTDWYLRIRRRATWVWMLVLAFIGVLCLMGFRQRDHYFGEHNKDLDYRFTGYTAQDVHDLLYNIGPDGRETYAITAVTLDLLFPLTFGTLMVFITVRNYPRRPGKGLLLLPLLVVVLDLLENLSIVYLTMSYTPGQLSSFAPVVSVITIAKWFFGAVGFLVLAIGIIGSRAGWFDPKQ